MSDRKIHWRCFHCGEAFTKAQERWARQHFGADQDALPACQMRLPGEHHLLTLLRKQEDELNAYRSEDTDLWRSLYAMSADHAQALRREEERGYEKGVRDGRLYPADHSAAVCQGSEADTAQGNPATDAPLPSPMEGEREAIARIIDEEGWRRVDARIARNPQWSPKDREKCKSVDCPDSLAKAEAILSRCVVSTGGGGSYSTNIAAAGPSDCAATPPHSQSEGSAS